MQIKQPILASPILTALKQWLQTSQTRAEDLKTSQARAPVFDPHPTTDRLLKFVTPFSPLFRAFFVHTKSPMLLSVGLV